MSHLDVQNNNENTQEIENNNFAEKQTSYIPGWVESILILPNNPAALTQQLTKLRQMQDTRDTQKAESLQEYFSRKVTNPGNDGEISQEPNFQQEKIAA